MVVIVIYVCLLNVVLFAVYYVLCIMCTPVRRTALLSTASLNNKSINQSINLHLYKAMLSGLHNGAAKRVVLQDGRCCYGSSSLAVIFTFFLVFTFLIRNQSPKILYGAALEGGVDHQQRG